MMKVKYFFYALLVMGILSGCDEDPIFPDTPSIVFISFEIVNDGAILTIDFTDGDGDVGIKLNQDGNNPDTTKNLFLTYYRKSKGVYEDSINNMPFFSIPPHYSIPYLTPKGQNKVLEGEIKVKIDDPWYDLLATSGDTVKYEIQLVDRALNYSNVVSTGDLIVP